MTGSGQLEAFKIVRRDQIPSSMEGKYSSASVLLGSKMRSAKWRQRIDERES
jgi:hypothetical protein